jgi:hypothetical protein
MNPDRYRRYRPLPPLPALSTVTNPPLYPPGNSGNAVTLTEPPVLLSRSEAEGARQKPIPAVEPSLAGDGTKTRDRTAAERMRRYRQRLRSHSMFVSGDVPTLDVEAAINTGWLTERESQDPAAILRAFLRIARHILHRGKIP